MGEPTNLAQLIESAVILTQVNDNIQNKEDLTDKRHFTNYALFQRPLFVQLNQTQNVLFIFSW